MYSFRNDYSEGAHPNILNQLVKTNLNQAAGYSEDCYTKEAKELLKEKIGRTDIDLHFIVGGTQVNTIAICAFLRPHEAAIAVESGHIAVHETGAIEATGHKVITVKGENGKMRVCDIQRALELHEDEHMVKPRLVYISQSTEIGTIYYKHELEAIKAYCEANELLLFIDGARLGSALMAKDNDLSLNDLSNLSDAFYIGGTKNGALLGEALVIVNASLKKDFRYLIKQRGALLAKGRMLGINFMELFRDDLFFELAEHANKMAYELVEGIKKAGYSFLAETTTNQVFPILPNKVIEALALEYDFGIWEKVDDTHSVIRLVTSWATLEDEVKGFNAALLCTKQ